MGPALRLMHTLGGAARSGLAGRRLRRLLAQLPPGCSAEQLYLAAWDAAQRHRFLFAGRELHANRFQVPWQNHLARRLLDRLGMIAAPPPGLIVTDSGLADLLARSAPQAPVLLCVHSRLTPLILTALRTEGQEPLLLRGHDKHRDPGPEEAAPGAILSGRGTLLQIRRASRLGQPVVAPIDFTRRKPGSLTHQRYLSSALVAACRANQVPLGFAALRVAPDGRIWLKAVPAPDPGSDTAFFDAFREFHRAHSDIPPDWEIVRSPAEVLSPRWALSGLCLAPAPTR